MSNHAKSAPTTLSDSESATVQEAMKIIENRRIRTGPLLKHFEQYRDYLVLRFAGLTNEQHHVLYLDGSRSLIEADVQALGDHNSVTVDLRNTVYRAVSLGASAVVFAHNHPSDNPQPSEQDVVCLNYCEKVLEPFGVHVLESYTVTSRGIGSVKIYRDQQLERQQAAEYAEIRRRGEQHREKQANAARKRAATIAAKKRTAAEVVDKAA